MADVLIVDDETVKAGLDVASGTLLVGESGYRATFWFRAAD